jgi:hypothetical protein
MKLERNEFLLCVDSTNGLALYDDNFNPAKLTIKDQVLLNIEDSIAIDHIDEKWSVDKNSLLEKLKNGTEKDYKKLWADIQQFWRDRDKQG